MSYIPDELDTKEGSVAASQQSSQQTNFAANQFDDRMSRIWVALGVDSDVKLARILGLKQQTISSVRTRKQIPSVWIIQITENFGISADWLLYGFGPMRREDRREWEKAANREELQAELAKSPVEEEALSGVIEAVEAWLHKHGKVITAEKKAQLIIVLYNYVISVGSLDDTTTDQYLRLVS
jgi:hypothetical protein